MEFECGQDRQILPTLRNKEIMNKLFEECGRDYDKFIKKIGKKNWINWAITDIFDPTNENIYWSTKEAAFKANEKAELIKELNAKYLKEKE